MSSRLCSLLLAVPLLVLTSGCGSDSEKTVAVKGQLTKGGSPFSPKQASNKPLPPGDPGVRVVFKRADGPKIGEEFGSKVDNESGKFEAIGATGSGIPPGKYTVLVYLGAYGVDDGPKGKSGPSGPAPIPGQGKPTATVEVTIPPEGMTDLTIEIDDKKAK